MKRKFLRRLQANFQSVVMYSMAFGVGTYCGMIKILLEDGVIMKYHIIALLTSFSAVGVGMIFLTLFYSVFGRTRKEKAKTMAHGIIVYIKIMCMSACKALDKAKEKHHHNTGITIYASQSRI